MGFIELWENWIWVAGAAFGIMTTLIAIVYMLAEFFMNDRMKGWAKMELAEIFYSAVLLVLVVSSVPVADSVVQSSLGVSNLGVGGINAISPTTACVLTSDYSPIITGKKYEPVDLCGPEIAQDSHSVYNGIESCHMRLAIWFMHDLFEENKDMGFAIYMSYIKTSMLAEFTINIEFLFEKAGFFTFTPWRGFYTMGNTIKQMGFDFSTKFMLIIKFQEILLRFIAVALFPALTVIGLVLRTFSLTRKLGGLLLAIALGLYFILPAFYAFGALAMLGLKNDPTVQLNWKASPANPFGDTPQDCYDVPIANTLYVTGDLPVLGSSGSVSVDDSKKALDKYESMPPSEYQKSMESGIDSNGNPIRPQFDLTSDKYIGASQAEKDAAIANAQKYSQSWFGSVSNTSMYEKFMDRVWTANGGIDAQARLTFWTVFFGLLGLLATIAGIRSLSTTFGGDIEIAGLTRLI